MMRQKMNFYRQQQETGKNKENIYSTAKKTKNSFAYFLCKINKYPMDQRAKHKTAHKKTWIANK